MENLWDNWGKPERPLIDELHIRNVHISTCTSVTRGMYSTFCGASLSYKLELSFSLGFRRFSKRRNHFFKTTTHDKRLTTKS